MTRVTANGERVAARRVTGSACAWVKAGSKVVVRRSVEGAENET